MQGGPRTRDIVWAACLALVVVVMLHGEFISNASTPGGDGSRVMPSVEYYERDPSPYPLWNPYKIGGIPNLADPYRWFWVGVVIDGLSDFRNLQFNLLLLAQLALFCVSFYLLARAFGCSHAAALTAMCVVAGSYFLAEKLFNGRTNELNNSIFITMAAACAAWIASRRRRDLCWLLALCTGAAVLLSGYYVLILLAPFFLFIAIFFPPGHGFWKIPLNWGLLLLLTLVGCLVFSCFLVPLVGYQLDSYASIAPRLLLNRTLPDSSTLLNSAIPLFSEIRVRGMKTFPFVSLALLPLLASAAWNFKHLRSPGFYTALCLLAVGLVVLLGDSEPWSNIVNHLESLPLLKQIRQAEAFVFLYTVGLALVCGFGMEGLLRASRAMPRRWLWAAGLIAVAGYGGVLAFDTEPLREYILGNLPKFGLAVAAIGAFPLAVRGRRSALACVAIVFALQFVAFQPPNFKGRVANVSPIPRIAAHLSSDTDCFRVYGTRRTKDWGFYPYGMMNVPLLNGISYYFSPEHREQMSLLLGREVTALRPHWAAKPPYREWNRGRLNVLNVKYLISSDEPSPLEHDDSFALVMREGDFALWRNLEWSPGVRLFCRWVVRPDAAAGEGDGGGTVALDAPPGFEQQDNGGFEQTVDLVSYASDEIVLQVSTNRNAVLYLPEYYSEGWRARVDDKPERVLRANRSFRAVAVPRGTHRVRLYFMPRMTVVGTWMSLAGLGAILALFILFRPHGKEIPPNRMDSVTD